VNATTRFNSFFGALKIDIDSFECPLMLSILQSGFRPAVIIVETMGCFPPPLKFAFVSSKFDMSHEPASQEMMFEKKWPGNCPCSVQHAIDTASGFGYIPIRNGDIWFILGRQWKQLARRNLGRMVDTFLLTGNRCLQAR